MTTFRCHQTHNESVLTTIVIPTFCILTSIFASFSKVLKTVSDYLVSKKIMRATH